MEISGRHPPNAATVGNRAALTSRKPAQHFVPYIHLHTLPDTVDASSLTTVLSSHSFETDFSFKLKFPITYWTKCFHGSLFHAHPTALDSVTLLLAVNLLIVAPRCFERGHCTGYATCTQGALSTPPSRKSSMK